MCRLAEEPVEVGGADFAERADFADFAERPDLPDCADRADLTDFPE